jgi:alpha-D-ribose 1-methylphosphonate 5-triphosphate synthase subunit PhnH
MTLALSPGFADPVADAQACFRSVLDAMARPSRIHSVAGAVPPAPLCSAAGAALLTLVDHETPLWLDPDADAARAWIQFHCGAPLAGIGDAAFGLALSLPDLAALPAGSDEAPETSATLILQVASLGRGRRFRLRGPGLRGGAELAVEGLPADFVTQWQRNRSQFPRGIDLVLCAGDQLAALPRSVTVEEA